VVLHAVALDPCDRYPDIASFRRALEDVYRAVRPSRAVSRRACKSVRGSTRRRRWRPAVRPIARC
jgi:hypothetical protein